MGVDWYACDNCFDTFPDAGYFVRCECGMKWCDDGCAEAFGFRREEEGFTPRGTEFIQETSCNSCREEDFTDTELLNFLIKVSNGSRDEVLEMYKEHLENEEE